MNKKPRNRSLDKERQKKRSEQITSSITGKHLSEARQHLFKEGVWVERQNYKAKMEGLAKRKGFHSSADLRAAHRLNLQGDPRAFYVQASVKLLERTLNDPVFDKYAHRTRKARKHGFRNDSHRRRFTQEFKFAREVQLFQDLGFSEKQAVSGAMLLAQGMSSERVNRALNLKEKLHGKKHYSLKN